MIDPQGNIILELGKESICKKAILERSLQMNGGLLFRHYQNGKARLNKFKPHLPVIWANLS